MIKLNELLKLPEQYQVKVEEIDKKMFNVFFNKTDNCNDVWLDIKSEKKRLGHPTQKPVQLIETALQNSSKRGDTVLDFFGGSGSTLIACEKMGRRCIMIELDPKYVDCIIARWEKFSNKKAKKLS